MKWKFWLIYVATPIIVIICLLSVVFYVYIGKGFFKKRGIEQGIIYTKVYRNKEALEIFKKELEKNPGDARIYYHMGVSYYNLKEYDNAITTLETALKMKPGYPDALLQLTVISLTRALELRKSGKEESLVLEKLLEAEDTCRDIIANNPDYQNAYTCLGEIHTAQGLIEDAIIDFEGALKLDNNVLSAHMAIARLYARTDRFALAEEHGNFVLSEIDPDNYQARILLSEIYQKQGELEKAVECLNRILKEKPEDLTVHAQLGLFYLNMSRYDEAFEEVELIHKLNPVIVPPAINFIEGCVLLQRKDYETAIVLLKKVTEKVPEFVQSHYVLAVALAENGRIEEAKTEFISTIDLAPGFVPAKSAFARMLAKRGEYNETISLSKDILAIEPDNLDAMQLLGTAYMGLSDFKNAEGVFQKIIKLNPLTGRINMARLSLATGQFSKCIRQCEEVIKTNPDRPEVYAILGLAYVRQGNVDKGIEQFVTAIEKNPRMVDTQLNLTRSYVVKRRYKEAIKTLENLLSLNQKNLKAHTMLANLYEKEGNIDKAIETLVKVVNVDPEYLPGYKLASLFLLQGRVEEAIDMSNRALELAPDDVTFRANCAVAYQEKGDYSASIESCRKEGELKPGTPFLNIIMTNLLMAHGEFEKAADYFIKGSEKSHRKDHTNAVTSLKEVTRRLPASAMAHYVLALAMENAGSTEEAMTEYETALDLAPGFVPSELRLARLLLRDGGHDENRAIGLCRDILKIEPDNLEALRIMGNAYMRLKDFENAEVVFQKIIKLNPLIGKINMAHLRLVAGQLSKCIKECEQIIRTDPEESRAHEILGLVYVRQGDFEKGIEQFVTAIGKNQRKADTYLNLAKVYVITGRSTEAKETLNNLLSFNPNNLQANAILADLFLHEGGIDDAANLLEKVLEMDPDYLPGYKLALLRLWQGRADESIDLCNRALKLAPEDVMFYVNLAVAYQQKEKYSSSILSCKKAVNLRAEMPFLDMLIANIYMSNGDFYKARKQVELASMFHNEEKEKYLEFIDRCENNQQEVRQITLALNKAIAARQRGIFNLAISEREKASAILPQGFIPDMFFEKKQDGEISTYQNLVALDNESFSARLTLANLLLKKGSVDGAVKLAEGVMELYPEDMEIHNLTRELFITDDDTGLEAIKISQLDNGSFEGHYDMVRQKFAKEQVGSLSIFNNDEKKEYLGLINLCQNNENRAGQIALALNRAIVAMQNGFFNLAISECEKAVAILPENLMPEIMLASIYLSADKKDEAVKIFNEIKERKPGFASKDMGKAYLLAQRQDDAISTYQNLVDLDNESVSTRLTLAGLLLKKGAVEEAEKMVGEAIQIAPENLSARNLMGELNLAKTEFVNAEVEFSKMLQLNDSTFEGYYNMARVKYAQDDIDECIKHCKRGLQIKPTDIRLLNILGAAYMKRGMFYNAEEVFEKIIDINSDFIPALINIAGIELRLNQPAVAVEHYRAVLNLEPGNPEARAGLGNAYAIMGKHPDAIAEFETLKKADPENVTIYFALTRSYLAMDKDDKAQGAVMKVLDLKPDNQIARSLLAKIYVKKNEIPAAIEQLKRLLHDNPKSTEAFSLGILYMDQGEYDNAITTYKQGIETFPNNSLLLYNLSIAYLMNENYEGARDACSMALRIRPNDFIPNLCMTNTLLSEGKFEEAERHLSDEASGLNNTQKDNLLELIRFCDKNELAAKIAYHLGRSIAYANGKWFTRVLMEYDEIMKIAPSETNLYEIQADILVLAGGDDEAIASCKKAIDLSPESSHAYIRLAGIYQRKDRIDEAEAFYKRALSIDPDNTHARMNLGIVFQSKGLTRESITAFERVIELEPSSLFAYNNLAWLYATEVDGKMGYALQLAEKARKLAPKNASILDTYAWIYFLSGKYDKSLFELKSAVIIAPRNPTIRYHMGMNYYKKGLHVLAVKELEYALRLSSTFPESKEANEIIERIMFYRESNVVGF